MFNLNREELTFFRKLSTPKKIQDFLESIPINFETKGETCMSPARVLRAHTCHCMEGAMFAAATLRFHGYPPLVVDLKAVKRDYDHVVAVFKKNGKWGAISKTNHAVLRYREPVYCSIRELAMSFFHEYFTDDGKKTLRSYSLPVNLARFDKKGWMTAEEDLWCIPDYLDRVRHYPILSRKALAGLRRADPIEIEAGKIVQWREN